MSSRNSSNSVKANWSIWTRNLPFYSQQKRDPSIPYVEKLSNLTRMPTNCQILGNFSFLFISEKRRMDRIKKYDNGYRITLEGNSRIPVLIQCTHQKETQSSD